MNFDYQKICSDLLSDLTEKQKEVVSRRFGLLPESGVERETLDSIGQDFGICRERVRQIEEVALGKIKPKTEKYQKVYKLFETYFRKFGDLRKEDILLAELGEGKWKNEIYFLMFIKEPFQKFNQNNDFHSFWLTDPKALTLAEKVIDFLYFQFQKTGKPLPFKELRPPFSLKAEVLRSFLEISKKIQKVDEHSFISTLRSARVNKDGLYGLKDWPEINPKGIRDKAYLVFKKIGEPLHFSRVADLIEGSHLQTVHNELIKDPRFVLVGRGTYALSDWGYEPGEVKDVIFRILKESKRPLAKEEILEKVSKQRLVKESTILLNLNNKKYFLRDSEGKYRPKTEII